MGWKDDSEVQFDHHAARGIPQLLEYGRVEWAPCMLRMRLGGGPDLEEWDTLGHSGKRWAAGTVL